MKKIIKNIALCGLMTFGAGFALSSCEDFLTITPTSSIVEEDYWQDKNDLKNGVIACYKRMVDNDLLRKYVYWGEERSDNFERSSSITSSGPVANIMNANLLPTYDQFDWTSMYNAINYCNKVLAHGPEVIQIDESFSENDWKPIRAEVITLRALCHFYLVRTFGEIPYVTSDYNNDSQELRLPQSTQLTVLDNIIEDLESIKNDAMLDYGNTVENKGRITKKAVYALLADVYLWRASYKTGNNQPFKKVVLSSNYIGDMTEAELASRQEEYSTTAAADYQKCIDYCDQIIDMVKQEKIEYINKNGLNIGGGDIDLDLEDLLAGNGSSNKTKSYIISSGSAYNSIFGAGNADESIFELQVEGTTYGNSMITDLYYSIKDGKSGAFTGPDVLFGGIESTPNTTSTGYVFTKTDYRRWETIIFDEPGQNSFAVGKYINRTISQNNPNSIYLTDNSAQSLTKNYIEQAKRSSSNVDANWIVYRLSEIYLMKAEAISQLYSDEENLTEAFNYVREVFKRSNPYAYQANNSTANNDTLKFVNFSTPENLEILVLKERQREFIGEGKRWYDLVRYALRRGSTSEMLDILSHKYTNSKSIKAKLADMQSLYSPVYNQEIKNNNWLYQNGVWSVNETSSRTDDL
ncbi:MAG: RagB/SusD family nutrient uptake outer membrane protein [Bacteroidaceae bacterium]|nr:RagB/SusD family nutrient uptake outer membrane protein [Bacteroidaceae bacterium]